MVAFTKQGLSQLLEVKGMRLVVRDPRTPGLQAELRKGGAVTFYLFKRRKGGGPVRVALGRFPQVTIEQARRQAAKALAELATGVDPSARHRTNRKAPTLGELFEQYVELPTRTRAKRTRASVTVAGYRYQFGSHLADWRTRKVTTLTRHEIETRHAMIGSTTGRYIANRVLALLKAILNHALDCGHIPSNPAARIAAFQEHSRERFLQADELPRFWAALDSEPDATLRDVVRMLLFTGQRVGNVLAMKWADVDLAGGLWRIPRTKTGRHEVPLIPEAIEILTRRKASNGSEYVFPGRRPTTCFRLRHGSWTSLIERAGIEDLHVHDLRRSLASWAAITGSSLPIIGRVLGHATPAMTQVYARLSDAPVRQAMATALATMLGLAATKPTG